MTSTRIYALFSILIWLVLSCAPNTDQLPPYQRPNLQQAIVVTIRGEAFVHRNNEWVPILPGDVLNASDTIRVTARSNLEIQVGRGAILSLQENTLFRLDELNWSAERTLLRGQLDAGTVISKVQKLAQPSEISIRSGAVSAGVRGTEFMLRRLKDELVAAVATGQVELEVGTQREAFSLSSNTEVVVNLQTPTLTPAKPLSNSSREAIARATQLDFLPLDEEALLLTRFLVRTNPPDADIVMGDRIMGRGVWGGIIKVGNQLILKVQKGGYQAKEVVIEAKEGENPIYNVELLPLAPEQTWDEATLQTPNLDELLRNQEATLAALIAKNQEVENRLKQQTELGNELNNRLQNLVVENADLNNRLSRTNQEKNQLQTQLQSVTQERDQRTRELETARRDLAASRAQLNSILEAREAEQRATNELIRQLRDQLEQAKRQN